MKQRNDDTTFIESPSTSFAVNICRRASLTVEHGQDSGIESVQASPSPINAQSNQPIIVTSSSSLKQQQTSSNSSPTPSDKQLQQKQRKLLHPDHARIIQRPPTSPDNVIFSSCFLCILYITALFYIRVLLRLRFSYRTLTTYYHYYSVVSY